MPNAKPRIVYVLGSDPGTANHGISVVRGDVGKDSVRFKVLGNAKLPRECLPRDFRNPYEDQQRYLKAVDKFFRSCVPANIKAPTMLVIERFQGRGLRGSQGELVSFMLSAQVLKYGATASVEILTAGTWKNQVNRVDAKQGSSKKEKLLERMYVINAQHGTNHQLDACLMSMYGVCKAAGLPYFTMLKSTAGRTRLLGEIKNTAR